MRGGTARQGGKIYIGVPHAKGVSILPSENTVTSVRRSLGNWEKSSWHRVPCTGSKRLMSSIKHTKSCTNARVCIGVHWSTDTTLEYAQPSSRAYEHVTPRTSQVSVFDPDHGHGIGQRPTVLGTRRLFTGTRTHNTRLALCPYNV